MNIKTIISRYVNTLILIPSILLLGFVLFKLIANFNGYRHSNEAVEMLTFANKTSQLVHQLQVERGLTAGFLGSGGLQFKAEVKTQRSVVNQAFDDYRNFTDENKEILEPRLLQNVEQVIRQLNELNATRQKIDKLDIDLQEALNFFTKNNAMLINQPLEITHR
ncbi:nitrate- and nitrite sensing domain-containing protein [Paraglaciecola sp.]|uniref:nitrate- and nitrite sensing domain-containing protein n=1 Tax=Paraglaciecola sp. TaxID=1920173 RepID=UPI0030F45F0E